METQLIFLVTTPSAAVKWKSGPELMQVISLPRFLLIIAFITIYYYQYVQNSALVVGIAC